MKRNQLEEFGITDKETIDKILNLAGAELKAEKDKNTEFKTQIEDLTAQVQTGNETIQSLQAKANVPDEIQEELNNYKSKVEELENGIKDRDYTESVKSYLSGYKFTSKLASDAVLRELKSKELKFENGTLQGADELMKQIQDENPNAFEQEKPVPSAVDTQTHTVGQNMSYTKEQIESMTPAEINANWSSIKESLKNI